MRVEVDTGRCASAGMCALTAPAVFDQNDQDGRVVLLLSEPPDPAVPLVRQSAQLCPSGAIRLVG